MNEAVLQSTLECYYNQSCVNILHLIIQSTLSFNAIALDPTMSSRYEPNSTMNDIIAKLMVEQWTNTTSHKDYYTQCASGTCTYTYTGRNSRFVAVTTIIGVFGGLTDILKIVVRSGVKIFRSLCKKCCTIGK
jgi:hypothetical protein